MRLLEYTTELYVIVDDFFKMLQKSKNGKNMLNNWNGKRGPKRRLTVSQVVTLNIIRFCYRVKDLKTFHRILKVRFLKEFPTLPNYENFLKASNWSIGYVTLFLKFLLFLNSKKKNEVHYVDSTDIAVCKNYNIYKHKVAKEIAARGKTSKGWFYGLKIHGVCDQDGNLENVLFTSGNVHDNQVLKELLDNLIGLFICDSGYLLKPEDIENFMKKNIHFFIATRKNMKRLMTDEQNKFFKKRSRIETNWDVLKERFSIVYSFARSIFGLLRHHIYSLVSFMLKDVNPGFLLEY